MTDSQRFRRARETLHWSRAVVAEYLGCTTNAVFRYETEHAEFARSVPPDALGWLETIAREFRTLLNRHAPPSEASAPARPRGKKAAAKLRAVPVSQRSARRRA
jgi:hypothetical protein